MIEQKLTIKEIETRCENEWVLIGEPETNEALAVTKGLVLHHSRDRDEVYRRAVESRPKRYAVLFTGEMPANTAIVL